MSFVQDAIEAEYQKALAHKLHVVNRRFQMPFLVSLSAVYGISRDAGLEDVRTQLNLIRTMLLNRTFDMARFEKRFPVVGIVADEHYCDQDRLLNAFSLCCWCRPPGVIYPPKTQKRRFRSCGHYNYCPACWARVVEQQFRQYDRFVNVCVAANPLSRMYATTHITEQFIRFDDIDPDTHADSKTYSQAIAVIGNAVARFKRHIKSRQKFLYRNTEASLWRIVPIAAERGWRLQLRQLFLTRPGVKPPCSILRYTHSTFKQTVLLSDSVNDDAVISFIAFSLYPAEHLKDDIDLTSASLNAIAHQHMLGGTGKFRTAGKGLIDLARKTRVRKNNGTQKTA